MASPVGHALAGAAIGRAGERAGGAGVRLWLGCAVLAVAPDLDFLPGIVAGQPALYHQSWSHSLGMALAVGGFAALVLFPDRRALARVWLLFSAAYASHLLLDAFGPDGRAPFGLPLLWPLSDATFASPLALLPGIQHAATTETPTGEWLASVLGPANLRAVGIELAVTLPCLLAVEVWRRRRPLAAGRGA